MRSDGTRNQTLSGYWTVEGVESHRSTNPGAPALAIKFNLERRSFGKNALEKPGRKMARKRDPGVISTGSWQGPSAVAFLQEVEGSEK